MSRCRQTRIDEQSVVVGLDTENILRHRVPHPSGSTREPRVLALTGTSRILTCYHLAVDIGFHLVQRLAVFLHIGRQNLRIVCPGIVAASSYRFSDDHPRVVVTEDTGILLIAGGVGGNLTHLHMISCKGGVVEHDAMFAVEVLLHGVERLADHSFLQSDAGHRTPALALNENLTFLVLAGANLVAEEVVGTQEPLAVPSVLFHGLYHLADGSFGAGGLLSIG